MYGHSGPDSRCLAPTDVIHLSVMIFTCLYLEGLVLIDSEMDIVRESCMLEAAMVMAYHRTREQALKTSKLITTSS